MRMDSRKSFFDRLEKNARSYAEKHHSCAEATFLSLAEGFNLTIEPVFKSMTGFSGGVSRLGLTCGAFLAAVAIIGLMYGRNHEEYIAYDPKDSKIKKKHHHVYGLVRELYDRIIQEYGSCNCRKIQNAVLGREFDLWDSKQYEEFELSGGHAHSGCPKVVGRVVRLAAELILAWESSTE